MKFPPKKIKKGKEKKTYYCTTDARLAPPLVAHVDVLIVVPVVVFLILHHVS